jgi:endonuclease/exonuclease/phosphatase family metal-dependent hydrolase
MRVGYRPPLWVVGAVLALGAVVLTLVVAAVRDGGSAPVVAAEPPQAPPVTVVTWNVCADTWRSCPYGGKADALAAAVADTARTQRADVVLLQEVCRTVLGPLRSALGTDWTVAFEPAYRSWLTRKGRHRIKQARCADDLGEYGLAVLARGDLTPTAGPAASPGASPPGPAPAAAEPPSVRLHPLPSPMPADRTRIEQRLALCVQLPAARLQVCNAHFSIRDQDPSGTVRARQADRLADELWFGERLGYATIVGGDLNATPAGTGGPHGRRILQPLYDRATECEAADAQRATYGGVKIDYLFAGRGLSRVGCEVVARPESDHRVLVGRFRPGPAGPQAGAQAVAAAGSPAGSPAGPSSGSPSPAEPPAASPGAARPAAFLGPAASRADGGALVGALRRGAAGLAVEARLRDGTLVLGDGADGGTGGATPGGTSGGAGSPPTLDANGPVDPWGRTLDGSFLRPLAQWAQAHRAGQRADSPAGEPPTRPFTLVVDLGPAPAPAAYVALERALRPYRDVLFRLDGGREVPGALRIVVPDTAALRRHLAARPGSFLFVEARPRSTVQGAPELPREAVAVVRVDLAGLTPATVDPAVLERQVRAVHQHGYLLRASGVGATVDALWTTLVDAGVDLVEVGRVDQLGAPAAG